MNDRAKIKYVIYLIDLLIENYYRNVDLHEMRPEYKKLRQEYSGLNKYGDLPNLKLIINIKIYYLFIPVYKLNITIKMNHYVQKSLILEIFLICSIYLVYYVFKFEEEIYLHLVPIFIMILSIPILKTLTNIIQRLNDGIVLKRLRLIKSLMNKKL